MPKKKKNQTEGPEEAPVNSGVVFSAEPGAAQGAAAAEQVQGKAAEQVQEDVAELIRSTLKVIIAQRKTYGLATTLTSLNRAVVKALENYLKFVPKTAVREYIKRVLIAEGYAVVEAVVEYGGMLYRAEVVMLYRNYDEIVEMVKADRMNKLIKPLVLTDGIDPLYDEQIKGRAYD
jgi:translation initiation factor IF-2